MAVIARIVVMFFAYLLACLAASLVLTIGTLAQDWNDVTALGAQAPELQSVALWSVVMLGTIVIASVAFLPALLALALAEGLALRSIVIYGAIGALLALATAYGLDFAGYVVTPGSPFAREREVLAAAGIAGGFVYWLFAGRRAGAWK